MLDNTYKPLFDVIEQADFPVLVVVTVADDPTIKGQYTDTINAAIAKLPKNEIGLFHLGYAETEITFPRIHAPMTYYFLPRNHTPVFWRGQDALARLQEDIKIIRTMFLTGVSEHDARFTPEVVADIKKVDTMLETEDITAFPSMFQQGRNLAKDMWNLGKKAMTLQPLLAEADIALERLETCQACPEFEAETARCRKCGCGMKLKTHLLGSQCPLQKWAR